MKWTTLAAAIAATLVFSQAAEAREHHHRHYHHYRHRHAARGRMAGEAQSGWAWPFAWSGEPYSAPETNSASSQGAWSAYPQHSAYRGRDRGRPAAWCGWEMRRLVGNDPGPQFNLARNWTHWGHSGPVGVGAVVVWSHHVGKIVGQENGQWVVESGNDGHALRTRPRSIAGAIAVRWG
jgi:hypothetical protein